MIVAPTAVFRLIVRALRAPSLCNAFVHHLPVMPFGGHASDDDVLNDSTATIASGSHKKATTITDQARKPARVAQFAAITMSLGRRRSQRGHHKLSSAPVRRIPSRYTIITRIGTVANAAANGRLEAKFA